MGSHTVLLVSHVSALVFMVTLTALVVGASAGGDPNTKGRRVFNSMEELQNYAKKQGKEGDQYLLEEDGKRQIVTLTQQETTVPRKPPAVTLRTKSITNLRSNLGSNKQGVDVNSNDGTAADPNQDTILDKVNNFNLGTYAALSKSFKKTQDYIEDRTYAAPLGRYVGPTVTFANLLTGLINQKNDNLIGGLYNGVRTLFGLKGTVVPQDFNHLPEAKPVIKVHDTEATKNKLDELDNLK
uniref:Uncharacterized protein n=1 Tax=Cacopsylla melanoneura TaxID=428564 RepID=A0A8D8VJH5_9HEMI